MPPHRFYPTDMYRALAWLIVAPLYVFSLLPLRVHYLFGHLLTWLLRDVFKYRRQVIDTNLKGAFPDLDDVVRRKIARDYYRHLGEVIVEIVWSMTRRGHHIRSKGFYSVDPEGERILNEAYVGSAPLVVLLSHTGNWEIASDLTAYMKNPAFRPQDMTVAYQTLHSRLSEQLFLVLRRHRLKSKDSLVPSHKILRMMLERDREPRVYFFIADQYPYGGVYQTNTFLGLETEWFTGAEAVARKLHLPVFYIYLNREQRGRYVIKISQICSDASQTMPGEVTDAYAGMLERDILFERDNWLWSHRRWKNLWPYNCREEKEINS